MTKTMYGWGCQISYYAFCNYLNFSLLYGFMYS